MPTRTIVVGVDGSTHGSHAVQWAAHYASALDARVIVAYAFEPPVPIIPTATPAFPAPFDDAWQQEIRGLLDTEWCVPLRVAGVAFEPRVVPGDPATALIDVARDTHADMIVVGRRGRNPMSEVVLESMSHRLSRHAPCPLVIIPTSGAFAA